MVCIAPLAEARAEARAEGPRGWPRRRPPPPARGRRDCSFLTLIKALAQREQGEVVSGFCSTSPALDKHRGRSPTTAGSEEGQTSGCSPHPGGRRESSSYFMGQGGSRGGELSLLLGVAGAGLPVGTPKVQTQDGTGLWPLVPRRLIPNSRRCSGGLFPSAAPTNHHRGLLGACARPRTQSSVDGETQGAAELPGPSCPNAAPGAELGAGGGHQRPPSASRDGLTGRRW